MTMTKINSFQHLIGDSFYHLLGHTLWIGNQLIKNSTITILKYQMQLLLPTRLKHLDQINKIFMF